MQLNMRNKKLNCSFILGNPSKLINLNNKASYMQLKAIINFFFSRYQVDNYLIDLFNKLFVNIICMKK